MIGNLVKPGVKMEEAENTSPLQINPIQEQSNHKKMLHSS